VDAAVAERRGLHLLGKLELDEFIDVKMEGFSSGQRQKVGIARALLHDPKVIVFDEPTTGLDVLTAKTVLDLLRLMREEGRTVIVSTHVLPMVEQVCDRVGIIFDGALHGDAPPRDILKQWKVGSLDEVFFALAAEGGN
jgi:sodium transport system ATP-binding protein